VSVTCVDKDAGKIERLKRGEIPIFEPGLDQLVASNAAAGRLGFTTDLNAAVEGKYDAAICLFSSISYNLTIADLKRTVQGLYDHLRAPGVMVFDTHFTKKGFVDGHRGEDVFDDGRVMGARLSVSKREGDVGQVTFSYLIKDGAKTIVLRDDVHRLGLFDREDLLRIMREVGFVETGAYLDWTFRKATGENQFRDVVFVGCKPGAGSI